MLLFVAGPDPAGRIPEPERILRCESKRVPRRWRRSRRWGL